MRARIFLAGLVLVACGLSFLLSSGRQNDKWIALFNGKDLAGWDTYLGTATDVSNMNSKDAPLGLNNDPYHVFSVVEQDHEKVIRISGEVSGGISTQKEFQNYHLRLMFKWGEQIVPSKKGKKMDSGLLYHAVGPHGADYGFWMRSQEFQIQEGDCGDYWGVAGGIEDIRAARKSDSEYVYDQKEQFYTFSAANKIGRHCIKAGNAEEPSGEWNQVDLYCNGDTSVHLVNNKLMMVLYHSRQLDNNQETPLVRGKIQIQSEGAEIFYKQIMIRPISSIPRKYLN